MQLGIFRVRIHPKCLFLALNCAWMLVCMALMGGCGGEAVVDGPRIQIQKKEHRWGEVMQGDRVQHEFVIQNVGNQTLRILKVRPGCGCMAEQFDQEIGPGLSGSILLTIDTLKLAGEKKMLTKVFSNDLQMPQFSLALSGRVKKWLEVSPPELLLSGPAADEKTVSVQLKASLGIELRFLSADSVRGQFDILSSAISEEGSYELKLVALGSKPNIIQDQLRIGFESKGELRQVLLPVTIDHWFPVRVLPRPVIIWPAAQLRVLSAGKTPYLEQELRLQAADPRQLVKVLQQHFFDLRGAKIQASLLSGEVDNVIRIKFRLLSMPTTGSLHARYVLTTNLGSRTIRLLGKAPNNQ